MSESFSRWLLRSDCAALASIGLPRPAACAALDDEARIEFAARTMAGLEPAGPVDPDAERIEAAARAMLGTKRS
ncbi:hypothetical protein [Thiocapsa sp. UBA6158]|jgi:hypothetical protein|uniref:hypothetical protein n=1 Tax=Thiocapsa sp. UBA6158 TaxID=1947692 RepID=UPI0025CE7210|nr:hypothetical protein [Thiocapsa sp. UBA6158]